VLDPVAADGNEEDRRRAFFRTPTALWNGISLFVNLPMDTRDRLSLQQRLDEIGATRSSNE
jgi:arsenate reductase